MLKYDPQYMHIVDTGGRGGWDLGAKEPPRFSGSTLYLLETIIVDLYQNLMLAFISLTPPLPN